MQVNNLFDDGKPEAGPGANLLGGVERVEDPRQSIIRNPWLGVLQLNQGDLIIMAARPSVGKTGPPSTSDSPP